MNTVTIPTAKQIYDATTRHAADTAEFKFLALVLIDAHADLESAQRRLTEAARRVQNVGADVAAKLASGSTLNSLGELQMAGPQMDLLCAEVAFNRRNMERLVLTAERMGITFGAEA